MKLIKSGVGFNSEDHTYTLNGKKLSGITEMIGKQLFPGKYNNVPDFILNKAANRGSMIHDKIELVDSIDIPCEDIEILNYKKIKEENEIRTIANEYIVTDKENFASPIDLVFQEKDKSISLCDIKTTYKLDLEYISWQLSIYAYLFEMQNPKLKVNKLYALWLRGENKEFKEVCRKPDDEVIKLMECEVKGTQYIQSSSDNALSIKVKEVEEYMVDLETQIKSLEEKKKSILSGILPLMVENGITSYKGERIQIIRTVGYTRKSVDSGKLEKEYPEAYSNCIKSTEVKESIKFKLL